MLLLSLGGKLKALPLALIVGGPAVLRAGTGNFKDSVKRTTWYIRKMERLVSNIDNSSRYDFALIVGTMIPGYQLSCPYFIYTDIPILANYEFPGGQERINFWKDCLPYERKNLAGATKVFTMSSFARSVLCQRYSLAAEKVVCVKAGCNGPLPGRIDIKGLEGQNILFVGVDWQRKGGPELLKAFQIAKERFPQASLTIVGCSPEISEPGVTVVGKVPLNEVSEFYARAAIFCMPSRREPFGIVYLEAMWAGVPVVASDCGATPDFVIDGQTGYRVTPGNIKLLAARLEELLADPAKRRQMGRCGRLLAEKEYTWQRTSKRMLDVILESKTCMRSGSWAPH